MRTIVDGPSPSLFSSQVWWQEAPPTVSRWWADNYDPSSERSADRPYTAYWEDCENQKGVLVGENQFFVGTEMLVAPVFRAGQRTKNVYLPPGPKNSPWTWTQLDVVSGKKGAITRTPGLEQEPTFGWFYPPAWAANAKAQSHFAEVPAALEEIVVRALCRGEGDHLHKVMLSQDQAIFTKLWIMLLHIIFSTKIPYR